MDTLKNTQEVLSKAKLYPKLKLGERLPGGGVKILEPKTVELVDDKIIKKLDPKDLKEKYYMRYNVLHNGELRRYETLLQSETGDPSYLVQKMGEYKPGDIITMRLAKAGQQTYVEVTSDKDDVEDSQALPHNEEIDEADVDTTATYIIKKECKDIGKEGGDYYGGEYGTDAAAIKKLLDNGTIEKYVEEEPPE